MADVEPGPIAERDVTVAHVSSPTGCADLARVLAQVWGYSDSNAVAPPDLLRALAHSGGYVVGVSVDGDLVGGALAWPSHVEDEWRLHSHVVGFLPGYRALGLGARVKHHQRETARASGFQAVEWTYDPLHARNASFNLAKLGARVVSFHRDFYGVLDDVFNAGLGSDRFLVRWGIDDAPPPPDGTSRDCILSVDEDGTPVLASSSATHLRAQIPRDVVSLRASNQALALQWREAFAEAVGQLMTAGARIVGLDPTHAYLIDR